jgi:flavin-dependent dehydrogenase
MVYDMTKPMDADVVVVSAGPAGSSTAPVFRRSCFVVLF